MITSLRNPKVARAVKLKKRAVRDKEGRFLVEGAKAVAEGLTSPTGLDQLFHSTDSHAVVDRAARAGVLVDRVSDTIMARLTSTVTPQGLVGVAPFVDVGLEAVPDSAGCVAVLHAVRDPGNAGTVLRSADGAGADAVVFTSSSVDVYNPKTVRASAGSLFHLPVVRGLETEDAVRELRERGFTIYATEADGEEDLWALELASPTVFVFGNEAWGLPAEVAKLADATVRVPLRGHAQSLNLAAAATLCLFEWARRRQEERRAALDTLIAAAAHDIRSPLTAMKGFGYALTKRWDAMSDEQRDLMLQGIVYDTDRLDAMVRQLVDAARVTSGRLELSPEPVDVGELVASVASSLRRDPELPEIRWESGTVVAMVDRERLKMAIAAFVEAVAWWAREGPIRISGELEKGRLSVDVLRAGAELSPDEAEALFQPRHPGAGAGSKIGLFVARSVAEAQGGRASVAVEAGGLRFRLMVPTAGAEQQG